MDFTLNFCEYNRKNPDYDQIYRPDGSKDYLFLLLKTPMKIHLNGQLFLSLENACLLYTPGTFQHYKAISKFRNSYVHFSCEENLGEQFGLPINQIFYPWNYEAIDEYIRRLQEEYISGLPFSAQQEYLLTSQLFLCAARGLTQRVSDTREEQNLLETFSKFRLNMLRNCEEQWPIERLCTIVNLEKSQLYAYYQKFFCSSPHADLMQVRLEKAKNLLTNEAVTVSQVAQRCGFLNLSHFSRCFKQECGCSPKEYAVIAAPHP